MTDTPEPTETTQQNTEPDDDTTTATDAQPEQTEVANPEAASAAREAAKWRKQFREAETQVATLTERLATLQRREVERLAADELADPADFWRGGAELADLLDDDGNVDTDKVTAAVQSVLKEHRHWRRSVPAAAPAADVGVGGLGVTPTDFTDAFRPRSK